MGNSQIASNPSGEEITVWNLRKNFLVIATLLIIFGGGILSFFILKITPIFFEMISKNSTPIPQITQNVVNISLFLNQYPIILFFMFPALFSFLFWWSKNLAQKFSNGEETSKKIAKKFVLINTTIFIFFAALNLAILIAMYMPIFMHAPKN